MTDSYFSLPKVSGKYRLNVDLSKTNWFGVGGRVKVVFFPKDISDLQFFFTKQVGRSKGYYFGCRFKYYC